MKRLSVCLIVKDEEELLPRCLDSVRNIADEIIIVDTGSTDRTKEIASEYTNLIFDYHWTNDFAAARNVSLQHATAKWILVMDADEYLAVDEHNQWIQFLNDEKPLSYLAYTLPVVNFTGDKEYQDEISTSPVTRLFPNHMGIHFERPIHEQLTRGAQEELYHKKIDLIIYHTGYQTQRVNEKNKHERNMLIFNKMKRNSQMSEYDWFTLGNQYRYAQDEVQALECYEKAIQGTSTTLAWYPHCLIGLISLYYKQDRLVDSWRWTECKLSEFPDYAEYYSIKGIHYETLGFYSEAAEQYKKAVEVAESRAAKSQEIWLVDPMYSFEMPVQQLVNVSFKINDNQQAIYWLSKLLNKNTKNPRVLLKLVEWLNHNEQPESIIHFLDQIYDRHNKAEANLLYRVSLGLGRKELVDYYESFIDQEDLSLEDHLRLSIVKYNHDMWVKYSMMLIEEGDIEQLWIQIAVGSLLWKDNKILKMAIDLRKTEDKFKRLLSLIASITSEEEVRDLLLTEYADDIFLIAKQLFILEQYECFDQFIQSTQTPELVNQLANYFYGLNQVETAMSYYSILLSQQQLDETSLENLGFYHANHGYSTETVEFLGEAVRLQPKARHLYRTLIQHTSSGCKTTLIERFLKEFPQFSSISFLKGFLNMK
ncbi:tetratricopeptide repeat-containing glycosyltransferase family 2 protein [Paenibacillus dokdonensis]|uniref:tetratricopeptide repeat-containing glycosyltransferase family 2 protein n=1 Tax=Paenibacillus dokdonensis TaxID=2567944 RepID=UPI0010A8FAB5|nr:glycosyltransferase family 2 protein [Paenibacillus dokdonensis]